MSKKIKILAVDDDIIMLNVIQDLISSIDDTYFIGVVDSTKAIDEVNKLKPDLVILDITMPILDGFELCKRIKSISQQTAIIFLSGETLQKNISHGLNCGAVDFIEKPFTNEYFISKIKYWLNHIENKSDPAQ